MQPHMNANENQLPEMSFFDLHLRLFAATFFLDSGESPMQRRRFFFPQFVD